MFEVLEVPHVAGRPRRLPINEDEVAELAATLRELDTDHMVRIGTADTPIEARTKARQYQRVLRQMGVNTSTVVVPEGDGDERTHVFGLRPATGIAKGEDAVEQVDPDSVAERRLGEGSGGQDDDADVGASSDASDTATIEAASGDEGDTEDEAGE